MYIVKKEIYRERELERERKKDITLYYNTPGRAPRRPGSPPRAARSFVL